MDYTLYLYNGLTVVSGASDNFWDELYDLVNLDKALKAITAMDQFDKDHDTIETFVDDVMYSANETDAQNVIMVVDTRDNDDEKSTLYKDILKEDIAKYEGGNIYVLLLSDSDDVKKEERCVDVSRFTVPYQVKFNIV